MVYMVAAAVLLLLMVLFGIKGSDIVVHYTNKRDPNRYVVSRLYYDALPKEPVRLFSNGCEISGELARFENSEKAVVLVHGITASRKMLCDYAELFHKKGYHVLLFDLPSHGMSGGDHRSFGFFEKKAVLACFNFLRQRLGEHIQIGLYGISMGGATALLAAAANADFRFVIADCPYKDLSQVLIDLMLRKLCLAPRRFGIRFARLLMVAPSLVTYLRFGWRFADCAPVDVIDRITRPVLLIHGVHDKFVRSFMSEDMHNKRCALGLPSRLELFEAAHGGSFYSDPLRYTAVVTEFLDRIEQ